MEGSRLELVLVLGFGVLGGVLIVLGLLLLAYGFSGGGALAWFGVILVFAAGILGVQFGFLEGSYDGIYSGP